MEIRVANERDASRLLNIYAPYVENTAVTFEYDVPSVQEFEHRISSVLKKYPYLVAVQDETILGYAYASSFHARAAYAWAAELSIYVDPAHHRKGVGSGLYRYMEELLRQQHVTNLYACIAFPNPDSIAFHEREGYRLIGHFTKCGYKLGRWWDMVWMEKMIGEHAEFPDPWVPFERKNPICT